MNRISFHEIEVNARLQKKRRLKPYLLSIFLVEKTALENVDIIFCNDEYLLGLNNEFLGHNYHTDTLTFKLSGKGEPVLGEIFISIDRVAENAKIFEEFYGRELLRVIIHSCLHLCGYTDNSAPAKTKMFLRQEKLLNHWFISRETS